MMETRMIHKMSQQSKILYGLFFLTLIFQDAGTFGVLPLNLFQILELIMLIVMCVYNPKFKIKKMFFLFFIYIGVLTIINLFDLDSIKTYVFMVLSIVMYYLFLKRVSTKKIIEAIFYASLLLAIYGCIQEFGYILKIPVLYDISQYGFTLNGLDVGYGNLMRVNSLYAEPAHLGPILGLGILIGLIECYKNKNKNACYWKEGTIIVCALLTQSFLVYMSGIMAIICFVFFYQDGLKRKTKWIVLTVLAGTFFCAFQWDFIYGALGRLAQFKTLETDTGNDLSALAIVSNTRVAIEKMKDGYLFGTGLDSHRLYYDAYIDELYSYIYMRLNSEDAASMYIRIFSEFGIVGLSAFCVMLVKQFLFGLKTKKKILVMSILMFMVGIMRDGSYMQPLTQIMFVGIMFSKTIINEPI